MVDIVETLDAEAGSGTGYAIGHSDRFLGQIGVANDRDWLRADLEGGHGYWFVMAGSGGSGSLPDARILLRDASGAALGYAEYGIAGSAGWAQDVAVTGQYFLDLSAYYLGSTGAYQLTVLQEVLAGTGTLATLSAGGSYAGRIDYGDDHDWVRLQLEANTAYHFAFSGDGSAQSLSNTAMVLRDAAGTALGSVEYNFSGGSGWSVDVVQAGTYYLDLGANSAQSTGGYTVSALAEVVAGLGTEAEAQVGQTYHGRIDYGDDSDWLRVTLEADHGYWISFAGDGTPGGLIGTQLLLRNATGEALGSVAYDTDGGTGWAMDVAQDGIFYIDLSAYSASATGGYAVHVLQEEMAGLGTQEVLPIGNTHQGRIDFGGDHDWLRVTLKANSGYVFDLAGSGAAGALTNTEIVLRDASGTALGAVEYNTAGPSGWAVDVQVAGTYYLDIAAYDSDSTGDYRVTAVVDTVANAGTKALLALGGQRDSRIDYGGDSDWVRVKLVAGVEYAFDLAGRGGQGLAGTALALFDTRGAELAQTYAAAGGSALRVNVAQGGTYFVAVSAAFGDETGDYRLKMAVAAVPGTAGADRMNGRGGPDHFLGLAGHDRLNGLAGRDTLEGGAGRDTILGGAGADVLRGDAGADQLLGGRGNDRLAGGAGPDRFIFDPGMGNDTITGFDLRQDLVVLDRRLAGGQSLRDLVAEDTRIVGGDLVLDLAGGASIRFAGLGSAEGLADALVFG